MPQDTYRFAYEEANSELREIASQYESLRARKERVEQVLNALRPLVTDAAMPEIRQEVKQEIKEIVATEKPTVDPTPFLVQQAQEVIPEAAPAIPESTPEPEPEPVFAAEASSDPFQRRIDNALKHGFGARESKILPRALNGLLSRA